MPRIRTAWAKSCKLDQQVWAAKSCPVTVYSQGLVWLRRRYFPRGPCRIYGAIGRSKVNLNLSVTGIRKVPVPHVRTGDATYRLDMMCILCIINYITYTCMHHSVPSKIQIRQWFVTNWRAQKHSGLTHNCCLSPPNLENMSKFKICFMSNRKFNFLKILATW